MADRGVRVGETAREAADLGGWRGCKQVQPSGEDMIRGGDHINTMRSGVYGSRRLHDTGETCLFPPGFTGHLEAQQHENQRPITTHINSRKAAGRGPLPAADARTRTRDRRKTNKKTCKVKLRTISSRHAGGNCQKHTESDGGG